MNMSLIDVNHFQSSLLGVFPNTYTFTKRMAEHVLVSHNTLNIPMLLIRPSIIAASLNEPFPGWTDSISLEGGIYLITGLGILIELPANDHNIADQVPVDLVANQIIVLLPQLYKQFKETKNPLMIS